MLTLDIEDRCFTILARQQPMAGDMRAIVTAIRLTSEIERSGDLMVNVAKATRRLYGAAIPLPLHSLLRAMAEQAVHLYGLAMDAYAEGDADLAAALDDMDDRLDQLHKDYIQAILELHADVRDVQVAVQLALVGRYYERIGDHAVNIGERVQYMVTGWLPEHAGAARLAARARGRRRRSRVTAVLAVLVVGARRRARAWCSSASSGSPAGSSLAGRRLSADVVPSGTGLAEATSVVERVVDRTVLRGGEGSVAEARLASALAVIPQGVVVFDDDGAIAYRNDVAAGYLAARHGEALVEEAIAELAAEAADRPASTVPTRTVDLFGPPRRTLVLARPPPRAGRAPARGARRDRRRHRSPPARGGPPRLRRQHQPRAEDARSARSGLLAETLVAEDDAAVAQRLAERMLTEAFRVSRTIDDLLELSRIEADEEARREEVPVHRFIAEAVDRVRPAAEQQGIAIEVEEPAARLAVAGDRRQLVSATYNLLENAVKYSDTGSTVQVRARTDGRWVDIEVQDHGIGIPRRDLERVFERFYRVDRARSRETGGTGLGLAIVRHVAGNHDGDVTVESTEGEGSTFTLRLPVGAGPVAVTAEAG